MLTRTLGTPIADIDTPALIVDLAALERNLDRLATFSRQSGIGIRPHAKSHKSPNIARMQLDRGAIGITSSKLSEAESLVLGGIDNILISSEIVGAGKIARLIALNRISRLTIVVDDLANARDISDAASAAGQRIPALVELNVGQTRCGVEPGAEGVAFAREVDRLPGLRFMGFQGYEGHLQHVDDRMDRKSKSDAAVGKLVETVRLAGESGLIVRVASTAGTGTYAFAARHVGVTDVQCGSYIFMDSDYLDVEGLPFESALTVLTTVVSARRQTDVIVDAGWKSITVEAGMPVVKANRAITYSPAGDEHGRLTVGDPSLLPVLGDKIELIPSHCDTTVNLYDYFTVVRDGQVVGIWPIVGRGRTQ